MSLEDYERAVAEAQAEAARRKEPEIPHAVVDEHGYFTVVRDGRELFESAPLAHSADPLFVEEQAIAWLWPGRIPRGMVT